LVGWILENVVLEEAQVMILTDHATTVKLKRHAADPISMAIASSEIVGDAVSYYNKMVVYGGALGHIRSRNFMPNTV
jgi:2,3-bisphosphoglycerate-independent phosphoglycerate mutase